MTGIQDTETTYFKLFPLSTAAIFIFVSWGIIWRIFTVNVLNPVKDNQDIFKHYKLLCFPVKGEIDILYEFPLQHMPFLNKFRTRHGSLPFCEQVRCFGASVCDLPYSKQRHISLESRDWDTVMYIFGISAIFHGVYLGNGHFHLFCNDFRMRNIHMLKEQEKQLSSIIMTS